MNRYSTRPSIRPFLPSYNQNAVIHLIIATGVCFVSFFFVAVCFQAFSHWQYEVAKGEMLQYIALGPVRSYPQKFWTLLTYGFFHRDFMGWVGNAIWIFTWGGVLQMLVGYRQVIPVFILGNVLGGALVLLSQLIPGAGAGGYLVGSHAGVMALAAAALMFAPSYRFWLTPTFSISIKIVFVIFVLLHFGGVLQGMAGVGWMVGGALGGVLSVVLLRKGYRIADRIYDGMGAISEKLTPAPPKVTAGRRGQTGFGGKNTVTRVQPPQARVDTLLEKIHAKGYNALSQEEKDFLKNAGGNI